jgi:hypothetical protein
MNALEAVEWLRETAAAMATQFTGDDDDHAPCLFLVGPQGIVACPILQERYLLLVEIAVASAREWLEVAALILPGISRATTKDGIEEDVETVTILAAGRDGAFEVAYGVLHRTQLGGHLEWLDDGQADAEGAVVDALRLITGEEA